MRIGGALRLLREPALVGLVVVALYVAAALLAPLVVPHDPATGDLARRLAPPAWLGAPEGYVLGGDAVGRDLLSRIIWGARASLGIGGMSVLVSCLVGFGVGLWAAYARGWFDAAVSRLADFLLAFPLLIFAIGVLAALGPGFWNIVLALSFKTWVEFFRVSRGETLAEKTRDYVTAARAIGAPDLRIIVRHLVPNTVHTMLVLATLRLGYLIIAEASLSFLGLGVQPPTPAWGTMVADGRSFMLDAWWVATFPGLTILVLVVSLNLLGEGLRDALDPRLRTAHGG